MLLVDHTDAEREFTYRISPLGRLDTALEEANQRGWRRERGPPVHRPGVSSGERREQWMRAAASAAALSSP